MRRLLFPLLALPFGALLLGIPADAQQGTKSPYTIDFDQKDVFMPDKSKDGKEGVFVRVKFGISLDGKKAQSIDTDYKLVIEENGKKVAVVDPPRSTTISTDLSVILALDTSGSMKEHNRMTMARAAAETFLSKLPAKADCGLVLFDHEIRNTPPPIAPTLDRQPILSAIKAIQPRGGTAFRDAGLKGVEMLSRVPPGKDRALVLLTDGADVNSTHSLDELIAEARKQHVRVFTIGIGTPGTLDQVSTALVLDHSGSMELPADDADLATPKIKALHSAAAAFIGMMSETGRVSLISFGSRVDTPKAFTGNKTKLKDNIVKLAPAGETAMLDAVYTGIATVDADAPKGRRVVVAMTDGIDNSSRRRVDEVIDRAKDAKIKLYLLGFGREHEIDHATMRKMATETGGKYYHAKNKASLVEIFEALSIEIHDDGIDEVSLKRIAAETGGQYYTALESSKLKFVLEQVTQSIQKESYEIEFKSLNQIRDGTLRRVSLRLVRADAPNETIDEVKTSGYQVHGLVVAQMHPLIYLVLLGVLVGMIALPSLLRRSNGA
jgi:VWFA-related protein